MEITKQKTTNRSMDLLTAVEQIVEKAKGSGLSPEFYRKANRYIKHVAEKMELSREQAVNGFVHRQQPQHMYPFKGIRRVPRM